MYPSPTRLNPRALALAGLADLACVLLFVVIGRSSHAEGDTLGGILTTGWPFWVGVAGGYVGVLAFRLAPASLSGACMVLAKTLVVGMILRNVVQQEGTPPAFVLVAAVFLGLTLAGWRVVGRLVALRHVRTASEELQVASAGSPR
jgi:FtsH-binding integral membrane protein